MADSVTVPASIFARAKTIILEPGKAWQAIAAEESTTEQIFRGYVLPFALIGPAAGFIGGRLFGTQTYGALASSGVVSQLVGAVVALVLTLVCYVLLSQIVSGLAPRFGGKTSSVAAAKLVAYSSTPIWLVGLFSIVPMLAPLSLLAFYSIYLAYRGVSPVMEVPAERAGGFTFAFVGCGLVLNVAVLAAGLLNAAIIRDMGLMN